MKRRSRKPAENDNSWLGIMGEGLATLKDKKGKVVGHCLDTPNCMAYAFGKFNNVHVASGLLGDRKRKDLEGRIAPALKEEQYFAPLVKMTA